ncbi:hypothetical protein N7486_007445 [Penicillium sp. IBT 16267x]|nr:hypothetical protein N7486_007445 [Penicillium sp. IBT 16267x]
MSSPPFSSSRLIEVYNNNNSSAKHIRKLSKQCDLSSIRISRPRSIKVSKTLNGKPTVTNHEKEFKNITFALILDDLYLDNSVHSPCLSSAQSLYESIVWDFMPTNPRVLADFGFDKLATHREKSHLVRIYQGLRLLQISADELQIWLVEGSLYANIKQAYCQVPESQRGLYFAWFLEHTWALEKRSERELVELI